MAGRIIVIGSKLSRNLHDRRGFVISFDIQRVRSGSILTLAFDSEV